MTMVTKTVAKWEIRAFYLIIFGLLALGAYSVANTNHQAYKNCLRVRGLQEYAVATIDRSTKTLPTLSYYKNVDHKADLTIQLRDLKAARKSFTPITCKQNTIDWR